MPKRPLDFDPKLNRRLFLQSVAGGGALASLTLLPGCESSDNDDDAPNVPGTSGGDSSDAATHMPRGLHVSFTGDIYTTRTVTWFTDGLEAPASIIEYDNIERGMTEAQIQNLPMSMRMEGGSEATPGVDAFTHRATARDFDPAKPLRYRVGSEQGWSAVQVLKPTPADSWKFVHFGDHGVNPRARQLAAELLKHEYDLLLLAGDLSYANGDQPVWDQWFDEVEPVLSTVPLMASPGNHEEEDDGGNTYKNRFSHPPALLDGVTGGNPGSSFYSFDYNRIHFLVTTAGALVNDGTLPEELLTIELDLATAAIRRAAGEIDFIAVVQHFTIWTDQLDRSPANPALVVLEENIMVRYGVDLLLVGHDHVYQRSAKMAFGLPNPLGYQQILVGTGGSSIRLFDEDGPQSWSAAEFIGVGFAEYEVDGTTIRGKLYGAPPLDMSEEGRQLSTGQFMVIDEFEIQARDLLARREAVKPPRSREVLLANYPAIEKHTQERNARHLGKHWLKIG